MEELRSTDILEKEIQNDAKKKAEAIIERGKKSAAEIAAGVQGRLDEAKAQKEKFYGDKEKKLQKDSDASVPLEKERFLVSFIGRSIDQAIERYLKNLTEERRVALAAKFLDGKESAFKGKKFSAKVNGFDKDAAKAAVEKKLESRLISVEALQNAHESEGIILESEDRSVKIRLTIDEIISEAKDKHYKEMCGALFGGRL